MSTRCWGLLTEHKAEPLLTFPGAVPHENTHQGLLARSAPGREKMMPPPFNAPEDVVQ